MVKSIYMCGTLDILRIGRVHFEGRGDIRWIDLYGGAKDEMVLELVYMPFNDKFSLVFDYDHAVEISIDKNTAIDILNSIIELMDEGVEYSGVIPDFFYRYGDVKKGEFGGIHV